mmetsp:Transcript_13527/g.32642  ORF Transcript_13527/g.32642 Transcript_13527/m.32642 type:complete len:256 (+) Transcript_13527:803-1570(+)
MCWIVDGNKLLFRSSASFPTRLSAQTNSEPISTVVASVNSITCLLNVLPTVALAQISWTRLRLFTKKERPWDAMASKSAMASDFLSSRFFRSQSSFVGPLRFSCSMRAIASVCKIRSASSRTTVSRFSSTSLPLRDAIFDSSHFDKAPAVPAMIGVCKSSSSGTNPVVELSSNISDRIIHTEDPGISGVGVHIPSTTDCICFANSKLGVTTMTQPNFFLETLHMRGRRYAKLFPDPVAAAMTTFFLLVIGPKLSV